MNEKIIISLGYVFINSLWIGLVVYVLYKSVEGIFDHFNPTVLYYFQCFALLCITAIPFLYFEFKTDPSIISNNLQPPILQVSHSSNINIGEVMNITKSEYKGILNWVLPYFMIFWIVGFLFFSVSTLIGYFQIQNIIKTAGAIKEKEWEIFVKKWRKRLSLKRKVIIKISNRINSPGLVGYLKPVILIPASMVSGLEIWQIEAIVVHELAHIKRHDFIVNIIQKTIEAVYFFNPFVWLISNQIRQQREICCDAVVTQSGFGKKQYAEFLLTMEEWNLKSTMIQLNLYGTQNKLKDRIFKIMGQSKNSFHTAPIIAGAIIGVSFMFVSWKQNTHSKVETIQENEELVIKEYKQKKKSETTVSKYSKKIPKEAENDENYLKSGHDKHLITDTIPDYTNLTMSELQNELKSQTSKIHIDEFELQKLQNFIDIEVAEITKLAEEITGELKLELEKMDLDIDKEALRKSIEQSIENQEASLIIQEKAMRKAEEAIAKIEKGQLRELEEKIKKMELDNLSKIEINTAEIESIAREIERRYELFKEEVTKELIKDKYLNKGEEIDEIEMEKGQIISINGKTLKPKHQNKYDKIVEKHLGKDVDMK